MVGNYIIYIYCLFILYTDHFMLMHAPDLIGAKDWVGLRSPFFNITYAEATHACIAFKYYMFGDKLDFGSLEMRFQNDLIFRQRHSIADKWHTGKATTEYSFIGSITFKAFRAGVITDLMDIAIDEVWVTPGVCTGENTGERACNTKQ